MRLLLPGDTVRHAAPLAVSVEPHERQLTDHAHGQPIPAAGGSTSVVLLIDDQPSLFSRSRRGAPSSQTEEVITALQRHFSPGDAVEVRVLRSDAESEALPSSQNLDELTAFLRTHLVGSGQGASLVRAVDAAVRDRAAVVDRPTHEEIVVVAGAPAPQAEGWENTLAQAIREGIVISAVLPLRTSDDEAQRAHDDALCLAARATGGLCLTFGARGAAFADIFESAFAATRSVFLYDIPCVQDTTDAPVLSLRVATDHHRSPPRELARHLVACPAPTPPPAPSQAPGVEVEPAPAPEPAPASRRGLALLFIVLALGALGGAVLVLRPKRPTMQEEDDGEIDERAGRLRDAAAPTAAPSALREAPFEANAFPINDKASALVSAGPVPDRPSWLRHPGAAEARRTLRREPSSVAVPHLFFSDGTRNLTMPLRTIEGKVLRLGNAPDCKIRHEAWPPDLIAGELRVAGDQVRIQPIALKRLLERAGKTLEEEAIVLPGDEICIAGHSVLELRWPEPGSGSHRHLRLRCEQSLAWDIVRVGATSVILGRNPLPYRGVRAEPCKRVIPHVSNDHLEVWVSGGLCWIRDLGSANGTYVAGERIPPMIPVEIPVGSTFSLANVLTFHVEAEG